MSCPKLKSVMKLPITATKELKKYDIETELADLKVECSNKDTTIQENERHMEEMKNELINLRKCLDDLTDKNILTEQLHSQDIETLVRHFCCKTNFLTFQFI